MLRFATIYKIGLRFRQRLNHTANCVIENVSLAKDVIFLRHTLRRMTKRVVTFFRF